MRTPSIEVTMTVEVAVLNSLGIAIAADSAQTIGPEWDQKIFTSADKIFALSWEDPIGVMVYGNAELLGLPWETIVKEYRRTTGHKSLPTVDAHAQEFISFITSDGLFSRSLQVAQYIGLVGGYYGMMRRQIRDQLQEALSERGELRESEITSIIRTVVDQNCLLWEEAPLLESLPAEFSDSIKKKYKEQIHTAIATVFEKLPLSQTIQGKLVKLAAAIASKWPPEVIAPPSISGIVIAGFGNSELFPVLRALEILTVIEGVAIQREVQEKRVDISADMAAAVVAFAQEDVVSTFMEGVAPYYQAMIDTLIRDLVSKVPGEILDEIPKLSAADRKSLKKHVAEQESSRMEHYLGQLIDYRNLNNVNPILQVVSVLPKDELASMADALANLTSLKRRLTMGERETVGGPIDVAVISRGDGLVWIKRKHYFQKELNPHFFRRHNKGRHNDQDEHEG